MERLKLLRTSAGLTQNEMCSICNVAQNTYSQWETGKREPDIKTLVFLSDFFHTSIDFLLEHDSPAAPPAPSFVLTPHEMKLIEAYRNHPALCSAVDRMLEVAPLSPEDEANAQTVAAVVEAVRGTKQESVLTK